MSLLKKRPWSVQPATCYALDCGFTFPCSPRLFVRSFAGLLWEFRRPKWFFVSNSCNVLLKVTFGPQPQVLEIYTCIVSSRSQRSLYMCLCVCVCDSLCLNLINGIQLAVVVVVIQERS